MNDPEFTLNIVKSQMHGCEDIQVFFLFLFFSFFSQQLLFYCLFQYLREKYNKIILLFFPLIVHSL